jgi:hypothetical protein
MRADEYHPVLREHIEHIARLDHTLARCPRAAPQQRQLFGECVALARADGLPLPPAHAWAVVWVDPTGAGVIQGGQTNIDPDGRIVVYLSVALFPSELKRVALHELKHVSDAHLQILDTFDPVEREQRAIEFSERLLAETWR